MRAPIEIENNCSRNETDGKIIEKSYLTSHCEFISIEIRIKVLNCFLMNPSQKKRKL